MPQDYSAALKWYRLAADQGLAEAQNNLGALYARGQGVSRDDQEALKWYRISAGQGFAPRPIQSWHVKLHPRMTPSGERFNRLFLKDYWPIEWGQFWTRNVTPPKTPIAE
jgi:hypothetical protein